MFRIDYDDSYILWLNGVEIGRTANIATLSPVGEIPKWDVSKIVDSMPDVEATKVPKGSLTKTVGRTCNTERTGVHETIHELRLVLNLGGGSGLSVEAANRLTTTWGRLKNHLD